MFSSDVPVVASESLTYDLPRSSPSRDCGLPPWLGLETRLTEVLKNSG